jgi:hypothetical protein
MQLPILIIAQGAPALTVARALRCDLNIAVEIAPGRRAALAALRRSEFLLVLLEEGLAASDPHATNALYDKALATPVLELNFAVCNTQRILRQVRSAVARRLQDEAQAREAATLRLQNELRSALTGLLLESQLCLREALPAQSPKLRHLVELAGNLRTLLHA